MLGVKKIKQQKPNWKKNHQNPKEFSLFPNFLIGIIQTIIDTVGDVDADSYLTFSPFIQKYMYYY